MAGTVTGAAFGHYDNPFRRARGLRPERVDMGVDYAADPGSPIYALGPGVIVAAGDQWRGAVGAPYPGTWIAEKITAGPLRGRIIYAAEDIEPAVHVGQRVTSKDMIGRFTGGGGIEYGFAAPPGTTGETAAAAAGQAASGGDPGAQATGYGAEMSQLLAALGAPPGIINGPVTGQGGGGGGLQGAGCLPAAGLILITFTPLALELARLAGWA